MQHNTVQKNRLALLESIENNSMIILFAGTAPQISSSECYDFSPDRNFYYITGLDRQKYIYTAVKISDRVEETLFIDKPDPFVESRTGKMADLQDMRNSTGIKDVVYTESLGPVLDKLFLDNRIENLYLDFGYKNSPYSKNMVQCFAESISLQYPYLRIKNIYHDICALRISKTEMEIQSIKSAIGHVNAGIKSIMRNARAGVMEYELEAYLGFALMSSGIKQNAFKTIAASGMNATILHYVDNNSMAEDGSLILFDMDVQYNHYHADITRTFPVNGRFTERQKALYNVVLNAQMETINAIRPGVTFEFLNQTARRALADGCRSIGLIRDYEGISRYYYHNVGHYLGLDAHDVGGYGRCLEPGMVITIEPGLYIREENTGIRIEDDVLVTEAGCDVLSKDIIKTVEEIERFMRH